jgi:hypothetical protein
VTKLGESLEVDFQEVAGEASEAEINRELANDILLTGRPSSETLAQMRSLPFSLEEAAGRLFEL